jgi:hypothetical protein
MDTSMSLLGYQISVHFFQPASLSPMSDFGDRTYKTMAAPHHRILPLWGSAIIETGRGLGEQQFFFAKKGR